MTRPIGEIASSLGISASECTGYGSDKAKVGLQMWKRIEGNPEGKLVLVTAINPTPAGEGKTTTAIGVADALRRLKQKAIVTLREPSLGPVFGMKGGATGGGKARLIPSDDINLHFTGDFHAVTAAHNLLSAMVDNHFHYGNKLQLDHRRIIWKRALDVNDRALRKIVIGLGGREGGYVREDRFDITAASEIMAILALSQDYDDLKNRLGRIVVGFNPKEEAVYAKDFNAPGAMTALLRDALAPNLVQTAEGTPAFVHCGPFANIAHGCNSILATRFALKLGDVVLSEAGFGSDLGGEKFLDIFCSVGRFKPSAAIIVASVRSLKYHGGAKLKDLHKENLSALEKGMPNVMHHIQLLKSFGVPPVVAINVHSDDTEAELLALGNALKQADVHYARCDVYAHGGEGGEAVAKQLMDLLSSDRATFKPLYSPKLSLKEKVETIARKAYGAEGVTYVGRSAKQLQMCSDLGYDDAYVCMAKTPYSLTDDPKRLGRPEKFKITVREVRLLGGARFVVPITGEIMTMPGLPEKPAAEHIDVTSDGTRVGIT